MSEIEVRLKAIEMKVMAKIADVKGKPVSEESAGRSSIVEKDDSTSHASETPRDSLLSRLYKRLLHWR